MNLWNYQEKKAFKFTDWMTGETIEETFEEGTPFADTMTGGSGNDILANKGNDLLKGAAGGDRLKGGKGGYFNWWRRWNKW